MCSGRPTRMDVSQQSVHRRSDPDKYGDRPSDTQHSIIPKCIILANPYNMHDIVSAWDNALQCDARCNGTGCVRLRLKRSARSPRRPQRGVSSVTASSYRSSLPSTRHHFTSKLSSSMGHGRLIKDGDRYTSASCSDLRRDSIFAWVLISVFRRKGNPIGSGMLGRIAQVIVSNVFGLRLDCLDRFELPARPQGT